MPKKARIILFDIENGPIISHNWGIYEQNALHVVKDWELLSFAYKVLGEKDVKCHIRLDYDDSTDKALTEELWKVLNEADVLVAHNAAEFDIKKANAKFIEHGLGPVSPSKVIDTLKVARANFKFSSNKLDDLGKLLKVGRKLKHQGYGLWLKCLENDPKAFDIMAKYNKQDVRLLERVYLKLLPWMNSHPNISTMEGLITNCPKCTSKNLERRGFSYTQVSTYQRYVCRDCRGWCKGKIVKQAKKSVIKSI